MNDTIGERIKSARRNSGLTQKGLAAQVGVPYQTIQYWENGRRNPKIDNLQKVADALGVDVNWLLRGAAAQQAEFARHALRKKSGGAKLSEVNQVFNTASNEGEELANPELATPDPAIPEPATAQTSLWAADALPQTPSAVEAIPSGAASASPVPAGRALSPLEVQLLERFRSLNAAGQSVAVERLGELAQLPAYKKPTENP